MLVPIALAVLLSFVLAPVWLRSPDFVWGQLASVLLAVSLAFAILGGLGAIIGKQVAQLAENLPQYQVVIAEEAGRCAELGFGPRAVARSGRRVTRARKHEESRRPTPPALRKPQKRPPADRALIQGGSA